MPVFKNKAGQSVTVSDEDVKSFLQRNPGDTARIGDAFSNTPGKGGGNNAPSSGGGSPAPTAGSGGGGGGAISGLTAAVPATPELKPQPAAAPAGGMGIEMPPPDATGALGASEAVGLRPLGRRTPPVDSMALAGLQKLY